MSIDMDYASLSTQYMFDINKSPLFVKDNKNLINVMGKKQLNTLKNMSLLDIFLSMNNVVEPHYHQNAAELVYCISGATTISMLNPFTKQLLTFHITPGQVVNIPQGWWHYEVATDDNTHLLAIFDAENPEVILGSDLLKFTPPNIMAHTYCLDEEQWKNVTEPIQPSTYIGPYKSCDKVANSNQQFHYPPYQKQYSQQQYPYYPQY